jgi:hypothetical protein
MIFSLKRILFQIIAITVLLCKMAISQSQDTIVFYNFDKGILDGFTTGALGLNGAKNNRCSWWIGSPNGGRGYSSVNPIGFIGNPDPVYDHSTNNAVNYVAGQGLKASSKTQGQSGYYNNSNEWIQSPPINCSNYYKTELSFWRWANFESGRDFAYVEISTNGSTWIKLPHPISVIESQWTLVKIDLSKYADHQPLVYIRWRSESDKNIYYSGWNIDDIAITGKLNYNDATSRLELGNMIVPAKISSLTDTYAESVSVLEFSLTDAATKDNLSTLINKIKVIKGPGNTIISWKKSIDKIYLYGPDLGEISGSELLGTVYDDSITFSGTDFINIASNSSEKYQLKLYLQKNLSNIKDNQRFEFTIESIDIKVNPLGSFIAGSTVTTGPTKLNVDIVASKLGFITEPLQLVSVNRNLTPIVAVSAQDENGNTDLDFSNTISLANSGSLAMTGNSATAVYGVVSFPILQFTQNGGPVTISTNNTNVPVLINAVSSVSVTIETNIADYVFRDNFDNSGVIGWTSGAITGSNSWKLGIPNGGRGYSDINPKGYIGNPDPITDHTSTNTINSVYGQGLSASSKTQGVSSYYNSSNEWLQTPAINCSNHYNTQLSFWRWANVQANQDSAYIEISTDGTKWTKLVHPVFPADIAWTNVTINISSIADRQPKVYIRWRLKSNSSVYYAGWNIDDVEITGIYSPNLTWTGAVSSDWNNAGNWSPNSIPDRFAKVTIPSGTSNRPIISSVAACNEITVKTNSLLEIASGYSLTVYGDFIIETDANNYGAVVDRGTLNVLGNSSISRYFSSKEWHYFSSPVKDAAVSLFGTNVFAYDEPAASVCWSKGWTNITTGNLNTMQGYNIYHYKDATILMDGKFNTGNQVLTLTNTDGAEVAEHEGWNLVGNPYPSVIDWDATSGWTKQNINNAIYIWDEKQQNFATYQHGAGTNGGSSLIPPMQGFFVKVASPGTGLLAMNNNVRIANNQPKFKSASDEQIIKIKIENEKYSDESVIRFADGATEGFDNEFDATKKFTFNSSVPQIYTLNSKDDQMAINTMPELKEYEIIPIRTNLGFNGDYNLTFEGINEFDPSKTIYLEDLKLKTLTDLRKTSRYSYSSNATEDSSRFVLHIGMPLTVSYSVSHVTERGKSDGAIDLVILGGVQSFKSIEWSNGSHEEDLVGVVAGEYTISIVDGADNIYSERIWIMQPDENGNLTTLNNTKANNLLIYSIDNQIYIVPKIEELPVQSVKIYNTSGNLVFENYQEFYGKSIIEPKIISGVYIVKTKQGNTTYTDKIALF